MLPRYPFALLALGFGLAASAREPAVGRAVAETEALFAGLPDRIESSARIAPPDEQGEPMVIEGVVRNANGRPAPGVILYAHHTNRFGLYPRHPDFPRDSVARRHGRLRGWVRTDEQGRYRFETIRPAGYPRASAPAHVHFQVLEPGRCTYVIDDLVFDDDPRLDEGYRTRSARGAGGSGLTKPSRDEGGRWRVRRDVVLGAHVENYPAR
jgi:protocatechuate 3,4-dioxygenase beta subunit